MTTESLRVLEFLADRIYLSEEDQKNAVAKANEAGEHKLAEYLESLSLEEFEDFMMNIVIE